jgi:hypothetical protein
LLPANHLIHLLFSFQRPAFFFPAACAAERNSIETRFACQGFFSAFFRSTLCLLCASRFGAFSTRDRVYSRSARRLSSLFFRLRKSIARLETRRADANKFRRRPTFPHSLPCSIIGAVGLNFCVRNGNRCDSYAIATENRITGFQLLKTFDAVKGSDW